MAINCDSLIFHVTLFTGSLMGKNVLEGNKTSVQLAAEKLSPVTFASSPKMNKESPLETLDDYDIEGRPVQSERSSVCILVINIHLFDFKLMFAVRSKEVQLVIIF